MKTKEQIEEWLKCAELHDTTLKDERSMLISSGIIAALKWVLEIDD